MPTLTPDPTEAMRTRLQADLRVAMRECVSASADQDFSSWPCRSRNWRTIQMNPTWVELLPVLIGAMSFEFVSPANVIEFLQPVEIHMANLAHACVVIGSVQRVTSLGLFSIAPPDIPFGFHTLTRVKLYRNCEGRGKHDSERRLSA